MVEITFLPLISKTSINLSPEIGERIVTLFASTGLG